MAKEYIEREAVYDTLTEYYHHRTDTQHGALREALSRVPAADVAEVVRCRECKHYHAAKDSFGWCENIESPAWDRGVDSHWFCADGERREVQHDN